MLLPQSRSGLSPLRCIAIGLLACGGTMSARGDLPALRTAEPIVVDGRLDEKIWASARASEDFVGPLQPDGTVLPAQSGARVRAAWNEHTLYFAFECDGPPSPTTLSERDAMLHTEEVVEVFLDFSGAGTEYLELQVSPAGVVADLYHEWSKKPTYAANAIDEVQRQMHRSDRSWNLNGAVAAAAPVIENGVVRGWTAEVSLPIANLVRKPAHPLTIGAGQTFRANFVHYRYAPSVSGGSSELQPATWMPVVRGRPHVSPMAMGTIRCVESKPVSKLAAYWSEAARLLVKDANGGFAQQKVPSRESRLGEAVTRLNLQPRTESNVESAAQTLAALVKENADDEVGIAAQYSLGRIEQVHRFVPNAPRALEYYDALIRAHPRHLFAQMAGVKACGLRLYETGVPVTRRLEAGEILGPLFTIPEMRRDYHLMMADAYVRFTDDSVRLLEHLLAADDAGHLPRTARADLCVRIVDAAERNGKKQLAIDYCRRFLAERTREARVGLVQERLRALEASP